MNQGICYHCRKSGVGLIICFYFIRSRRYRVRQKERKLQNLEKAVRAIDSPGLEPKADSYVRRKSSEIRKLLPKSPTKAVSVIKHLWNQMYKSPRKRKVIDNLCVKDKHMGKFMYKIGKYRHKKNEQKLGETVQSMKNKYSSLCCACRETNLMWSQFHKCTKLSKHTMEHKKYICKLSGKDIKSITKFFSSEEVSFPLPDKKILW